MQIKKKLLKEGDEEGNKTGLKLGIIEKGLFKKEDCGCWILPIFILFLLHKYHSNKHLITDNNCYNRNENNSTIKRLFHYRFLLLELRNKCKGLVGYFGLCSNSVKYHISYIFAHIPSSAYKNHPIISKDMLLQPILVLLQQILHILLYMRVLSALGQFQLQDLLLLKLEPLLSVVEIDFIVLNAKVAKLVDYYSRI